MLSENRKERLGTAFLMWLCMVAEGGLDWLLKGKSPLIWHNFLGVVEWLAWTAVAGAILELSYHQLSRDLPNESRSADAARLMSYLARALLGIGLLFALAAARFVLYAGDARYPHWREFVSKLMEHRVAAVAMVAGLFVMFGLLALLIFAGRLLAIGFRRYSPTT